MSFQKNQPSWNKGLKIAETHPQMGFQKENQLWNNPETEATWVRNGEHLSPKTEFQKGKRPWNYIEDRTLVEERDHHFTAEYISWRTSVFERDGWKCKIANTDCNGQLEAHHILPWREYGELRYEINNGITLCHTHHPRRRAEEKRLSPYFQDLVSVS